MRNRRIWKLHPLKPVLAAVLMVAVLPGTARSSPEPAESNRAVPVAVGGGSELLAGLEPRIEQNRGQFDPEVRYVAQGPGYTLFLTDSEAVFDLGPQGAKVDEPGKRPVVRMAFVGGRTSPVVDASSPRPGVSNYLKGSDPAKWVRSVPSFGRVSYRDLYPGIDLVFRGNDDNELEYDFVVAPGADPSVISLGFSGHENLSVADDGGLVITTPTGEIRQHAPVVFQEADGKRTPVSGAFALDGNRVGFDLGRYDRNRPLVIDPVVTFSTLLGGAANDEISAVALDAAGSAYVTGSSCPSQFPLEGDTPPRRAQTDSCDAFVAKLTPDGSALAYITYLGGNAPAPYRGGVEPAPESCTSDSNLQACKQARSRPYPDPVHVDHDIGSDAGTGIAVDGAGRAFVAGYTYAGDFPTTPNAYDRSCGAGITRPAPPPPGSACESYRHVEYVATVPVINSGAAHKATNHNYWVPDAFVTRLSDDGKEVEYSTYLGGAPNAGANPLTHRGPRPGDWSENVDPPRTVATSSGASPIPDKPLASGTEIARGIAVDPAGNAYVTGATTSPSFPTTAKAFDRFCGTDGTANCDGGYRPDAFVTKVNTRVDGTDPANSPANSLVYSTYLGGGGVDSGSAIVFPGGGDEHIYVAGRAQQDFPTSPPVSTSPPVYRAQRDQINFPSTCPQGPTPANVPPLGHQAPHNDYERCGEGFVVKILPSASSPAQSLARATYLNVERVNGLAVGADGTSFVTGYVNKRAATPAGTTIGATSPSLVTAFVAKMDSELSALSYFTYIGGKRRDAATSVAVDSAGAAYVTGIATSCDFPTRNPFNGTLATDAPCRNDDSDSNTPPWGDAFLLKLNPTGSVLELGTYLGGTHRDVARSMAIGPNGDVVVAGTTISGDFPTSDSAYQQERIGAAEGFVTKIATTSSVPQVNLLEPNRGPTSGGTTVTISGSDFAGVEEVRFGARPAAFTLMPNGQIEAVSPAQPDATARVTVTGSAGRSASFGTGSVFVYGEGAWDPGAPEALSPNGRAVTILDGPKCRVEAPPQYCGQVLVVGEVTRLFNPRTGTWNPSSCPDRSICPNQPAQGRFDHTSTLLNDGRVLIAGGRNRPPGSPQTPHTIATAELYDPASGRWSLTDDMAVERSSHTATLLADGRVLIAGGFEGNPFNGNVEGATDSVEIFDLASPGTATRQSDTPVVAPTAGGWSPARPMTEALGDHTATLLTAPGCSHRGGTLFFVMGGSAARGGPATARAELFRPDQDPQPGTERGGWEAVGTNPGFARAFHTATQLPDGKVLLLGGGTPLAELFDPASADQSPWRFAGSMEKDRRMHVAALLPNGKVLVTGGIPLSSGISVPNGDAELYEPDGGTWRSAATPPRPPGNATAVVLSGRADKFEANALCRPRCGLALIVNGSGHDLYTPAPSVTSIAPPTGNLAGGTDLTFAGTGLDDSSTVLFDGRPGTDVREVTNYTQISAKSPAMLDKTRPEIWVSNRGGPTRVKVPFRYTGPPGSPNPLDAIPRAGALDLEFRSAGSVANADPPATIYQLRRSSNPITSASDFDAADVLACAGSPPSGDCKLEPATVGQALSIAVAPPPSGRTRYYAVRAVNDDGDVGPFATASYTSPGSRVDEVPETTTPQPRPPTVPSSVDGCPAVSAGAGQVVYPAGYSLIGLPAGTQVPTEAPMYSWMDLGNGGAYSAGNEATSAGHGYWAWFACPKLVDLTGGTAEVSLPLGEYHASMVGNPSTAPATVTGQDFAARWDPSLNNGAGGYHVSGYRQAQPLAVGEGAWVFSYAKTEVRVGG